jgi:cysteine desulfuration protein SufE
MNIELQKVKDNFLLFDSQLDKFEYLIELGKNNQGLSDSYKIDNNLIIGCASKSWVVCYQKDNLFFIDIDSEALIVRGLLSILQIAINGKTSSEIMGANGIQILTDIGMGNSITSQRMNGFISALKTIKVLVDRYE